MLCPKRSLSGSIVLCPVPADWMKEGVEVGPLQLAGKLEELPLSEWESAEHEER